jgi:mycofactocin system creatininase family protein
MTTSNDTSTELPPLALARWPEVDRNDRPLLIVPVGSLEQHGPHLPLATDARIASAVAARVHATLPQVGLAPCIPIGASGEHAGFPGTLSIGTDALALMMVELVRHASLFWEHVLVINGHGGNATALRSAQQACQFERRSLTLHHIGWEDGDAHAGLSETSLMLHLAPELVRMELAETGNTEPLQRLLPRLIAGGVRSVSENGVLGDPRNANAETGAGLFSEIVEAALKSARRALGNIAEAR